MIVISKLCNQGHFEACNYLKFSFTNIRDLRFNSNKDKYVSMNRIFWDSCFLGDTFGRLETFINCLSLIRQDSIVCIVE